MSGLVQPLNRQEMLEMVRDQMPADDLKQMMACATLSQHLFAGVVDDKLICIYGLVPPTLLSDHAYLWLYVTPDLKEYVFTFVRHSQRMVAEILETYPIITGDAQIGNDKAIRWLKWLGARFDEPNGQKLPFVIRAKQ